MKTLRIFATATLSIAVSACASTAPQPAAGSAAGGPTPEQAVAFLDKSRDGKVGREEYLTFQGTRFPGFDTNKDGTLSREEFQNAQPGERAKSNAGRTYGMFHRGDGGMTENEFIAFHSFVFANFVDTNKDGFMSGEEWTAIMER